MAKSTDSHKKKYTLTRLVQGDRLEMHGTKNQKQVTNKENSFWVTVARNDKEKKSRMCDTVNAENKSFYLAQG